MTATQGKKSSLTPYTFKPGAFSSHTLLLNSFPAHGGRLRVVDIGGGEGYLSRLLAQRHYCVVCVAAPGSVAEDFRENVEVVEADLDFERPKLKGLFDYAICGDILEHLRSPELTLCWIRDVLAPEGKLVASLPNSGHAYVRLNVMLGRFPKHDRGLFDRTHPRFYSLAGWKELFASCRFRIESLRTTAVPVCLAFPRWQHSQVVRAAEWLAFGLANVWKTLFAYQFVVVVRPV